MVVFSSGCQRPTAAVWAGEALLCGLRRLCPTKLLDALANPGVCLMTPIINVRREPHVHSGLTNTYDINTHVLPDLGETEFMKRKFNAVDANHRT